MNKKVRIDFISDAVCPWCAIGYTKLNQAISELNLQEDVDIQWQPFFLNPDMPKEGENIYDYGTRKYGRTKQEGDLNRANITRLGEEAGFSFNFTNETRVVNTRDAHTLLDHLQGTAKQTEFKARLFEAYFTEQKDISMGVSAVPTMIFNNDMMINGSRSVESYKQILLSSLDQDQVVGANY